MTCKHTKSDGARCRAQARAGGLCPFHDPALEDERAAGRRAGGAARSKPAATLPPDTPDLPLRTVADVRAALAETFNLVRTGRMDCRVGNCLGVLAGVLMKSIEGGELVARVEAIESEARGKGRRR